MNPDGTVNDQDTETLNNLVKEMDEAYEALNDLQMRSA